MKANVEHLNINMLSRLSQDLPLELDKIQISKIQKNQVNLGQASMEPLHQGPNR